MSQKNLAGWLKIIIGGLVVLAVLFFFVIVPIVGNSIIKDAPEFAGWFVPWLLFAWITAVPCFVAAFFAWRVAGNIGKDRSFSMENAILLKRISLLAAADSAVIVVGNFILGFLGMSHPSVFIVLLMVAFIGVAVSVACAALSHLVRKAADLQQESDLTI